MNLNSHHYRIYLCVQYVICVGKNVKPPSFLTYLWLLRAINPPPPPHTHTHTPLEPLVKCECIYFCANVPIWINLRKIWQKIWVVDLLSKKKLIFRLIITNFAPDRTIFTNFSRTPLTQVIINIIPGLPTHLVCKSLSR